MDKTNYIEDNSELNLKDNPIYKDLSELIENKTIKWLPWIGENYTNLLLVGESHYQNSEEDKIEQEDSNYQIKWGKSEGKQKVMFYKKMAHMVIGNTNTQELFDEVAQMNLIQRPMTNISKRPNKNDYQQGIQALFAVVGKLKTKKVIVFSKGAKKHFDSYRSDNFQRLTFNNNKIENNIAPVRYTDLKNGVEYLLIAHPSRMNKLDEWHAFIDKFNKSTL